MNFCPKCNFLLYKNLKSSTSSKLPVSSEGDAVPEVKETYESILSPDMSQCSLVEYCKNCGYETEVIENNISVYKRNYKNDFIVDRILKNKYTIYDSTLPRLDIKCKNNHCITHKSSKELSVNNSIIVNNIPEHLTLDEIFDILEPYSFGTTSKIVSPDKDYIKTINGHNMFVKRIKLCQAIVYFESTPKRKKTRIKKKASDTASTGSKKAGSYEEESKKVISEILTNFKEFIEDYTLNIKSPTTDDILSIKQFRTEPFKLPNNEIIYIKYDPGNMKYLYMCVNCGESW